MENTPVKIGIYIDGFNLYYGLFRHGPPECKQYNGSIPFSWDRNSLSGSSWEAR